MRLVLDTNVVISALLWRGTPYRLLEAIRRRDRLQLYSSFVLLEELTDVITQSALSKRLAVISKSARELYADYLETIELVEPVDIPRTTRDPDDDHILATASTATADLIVSGDHDLLTLERFQGIPILSPAETITIIGDG